MTRTRPQPDFQLPYQPSERARPFNVLLIVIDDLRGDHLACAGYERDTAPNLERRLSSGTYFSPPMMIKSFSRTTKYKYESTR